MQLWMAVLLSSFSCVLEYAAPYIKHHEPYLLADSGRGMTEWRAQKRLDGVAQKWRATERCLSFLSESGPPRRDVGELVNRTLNRSLLTRLDRAVVAVRPPDVGKEGCGGAR